MRWQVILLCIPAAAFATGKIEVVGPSSVDFGKYPAWEKRVGKYTIRNAGDGVLDIVKIRKGCGCATATASKTKLQPGETAKVEVEIRANSIYGVYKKKCFVETTDPQQKFTRLDIGGNAVPLADVRPSREFHAGRLPLGRPWSKAFQIVPRGKKALKLGEPRVTGNDEASAKLGEVEDGVSYRLNVSLDPPKASGDWKCEVGIPVLSPTNHAPLAITVTAAIGEILICIPSMTYLKVSDEPVERVFHVRLLPRLNPIPRKASQFAWAFEEALDAKGLGERFDWITHQLAAFQPEKGEGESWPTEFINALEREFYANPQGLLAKVRDAADVRALMTTLAPV